MRPKPLPSCLLLVLTFTAPVAGGDAEWTQVRDRVDELLARQWEEAGVEPAPPADAATFHRRARLDLTGVIPTAGEVQAFLADDAPDARQRLVDRLIGNPARNVPANPRHATYLAARWREAMLPENSGNRFVARTNAFDVWLRQHFADNTPYDELARELLTAEGNANQAGPVLYYTSLGAKPEKLAASTSRLLLGVQIECAQCHDHPFDRWTQRDFWGYAAFFAQLRRTVRLRIMDTGSGEVTLPDTDEVVPPQYLGETLKDVDTQRSRRERLATWVTSPRNPYFARATVNRLWALLFGYGLVEPVDDFGAHNPPSHPELLDLLARDFADHGFDVRRTLRILANTRAYRLSSEVREGEEVAPRLFARMPVKTLSAQQVLDCLQQATGQQQNRVTRFGAQNRNAVLERRAFLAKFSSPSVSPTEFDAGIPLALTMMNGAIIAAAVDVEQSALLTSVLEAPFFDDRQRIETLFLATLSRPPRPDERRRLIAFLREGGLADGRRKFYSDVLWALLNSPEFLMNH